MSDEHERVSNHPDNAVEWINWIGALEARIERLEAQVRELRGQTTLQDWREAHDAMAPPKDNVDKVNPEPPREGEWAWGDGNKTLHD